MAEEIINRVNQSGLTQIDLEEVRVQGERVFIDIKDQLFQGIALREKDFREFIAGHDWSNYAGKHVAVGCSEDAIIPTWAYMLLGVQLTPFVRTLVFGDLTDLEKVLFSQALAKINPADFQDAKIVIKGCSKESVPTDAYLKITQLLQPVAKSLFFGEPCSTVPLYKRK
jgi:Protein of unknown function (DUF2480)